MWLLPQDDLFQLFRSLVAVFPIVCQLLRSLLFLSCILFKFWYFCAEQCGFGMKMPQELYSKINSYNCNRSGIDFFPPNMNHSKIQLNIIDKWKIAIE